MLSIINKGEVSPSLQSLWLFRYPLYGAPPRNAQENKEKIATQFYLCRLCIALSPKAGGWFVLIGGVSAPRAERGALQPTPPKQTTPLPSVGFCYRRRFQVCGLPSSPPFLVIGGYNKSRGLYYVQHKQQAVLYSAILANGFRLGSPSCLGSWAFHDRNSGLYH